MPIIDYSKIIEDHLNTLPFNAGLDQIAQGMEIVPEHERGRLVATAKGRGYSASDLNKAISRSQVIKALGKYPTDISEYVQLYMAKHKVSVRFNGLISVGGGYSDAVQEMAGQSMQYRVAQNVGRSYWPAVVKECDQFGSLDLRLGYSNYIPDACGLWYEKERRQQAIYIGQSIMELPANVSAAKVDDDLLNLVIDRFACDSIETPAYYAAIIRKFMWQVKRKLIGEPVTDHLMPVLFGGQGGGKSTLIAEMVQPIADLSTGVSFVQIADERNVDIYSYYVGIISELEGGKKAEVVTIKAVITKSVIEYRPMKSNGKTTVPQNLTLIGDTNVHVADVIKDDTGMRRFVEIRAKELAQMDFTNLVPINWTEVWQSVDPLGPDPMIPFKAQLMKAQAGLRNLSPIEAWATDFNQSPFWRNRKASWAMGLHRSDIHSISARDLLEDFNQYEKQFHNSKTTSQKFGRDLTGFIGSNGFPFHSKQRTDTGFRYTFDEGNELETTFDKSLK